MEIIKRGVPPEKKPIHGTCSNCQTEISFTRDEAEYSYHQIDGGMFKVKCPVCGEAIFVLE